MAKDPAFLFYPGDWLGGTMTFSRSHKGAYMDLLMVQFNNGHMSLQDIEMILGNDFNSMWEPKLKAKFKQDSAGLFFNQKLEDETIKRKNFTESRKKNLTNKPEHTEPHKGNHMNQHMENGNENVNKDEVIVEKKEKRNLNFLTLQDSFVEKWDVWIKFKKSQFKQTYKTKESEQVALNHLIKLSGGDCVIAEKIIDQSIGQLWKGLFELKEENQKNGKSNTVTSGKKIGRIPEDNVNEFLNRGRIAPFTGEGTY